MTRLEPKILLIEGTSDLHWVNILRRAISRLGKSLVTMGVAEIERKTSWKDFELIIFDAKIARGLPQIISQIRSQTPDARIIVFSSAPEWKEATEVMLAGALDYERKPLVEKDVLLILRKNLLRIPPNMSELSKKVKKK
jgi:DNA-binding NtrC family response regulator